MAHRSKSRPKTKPSTPKGKGKRPRTNNLWGGRFEGGFNKLMETINASIHFDRKLYIQDIKGSLAHAAMLADQGMLSTADAKAIARGLAQVREEIAAGKLEINPALEDIHMHVETRLAALIGSAAGRLHTARSRNDQVATDVRLWVRDAIDRLDVLIADLQRALVLRAESEAATLMPGYTHLQPAQPVTFGHHLMAYVEMFARDRGRLGDARARLNESPLGAAALAGTSYPIDRKTTAKALGFDRPMANSMDAVAARDFALEYLAAGSIFAVQLSRLAEEIVLWMSPAMGFIALSDAFTSGSSIMPQKKNPDAAELVRGKSGRTLGHLMGMLTVVKGLPLTYSKDLQEDKEPLFDAAETLELCAQAMTGMIRDMTPNRGRMRAALDDGFITATDLADWLVQSLGMAFRDAHHVTGRLVKLAEDKAVRLEDLTLDDMKKIEPRIRREVYERLRPESAVATRVSYGGTAPKQVKKQVTEWKKKLGL